MKSLILLALLPLPAFADIAVMDIIAGPDQLSVFAAEIAKVAVTGPAAAPAVSVVLIPAMDAPVEALTRAHVGEELLIAVCGEEVMRPILRDPIREARFMLTARDAAEARRIAGLLASPGCLR